MTYYLISLISQLFLGIVLQEFHQKQSYLSWVIVTYILMIFLNIIKAVISATCGVLMIGSFGAIMTHRKVMNKQFTTILSSLVERLFLPSLIFTSFLKAININTILSLVPSIITTFVCVLMGYIIGLVSNKYWIKEKKLASIVALASANPHTTNVQLQLSYGLTQYFSTLTGLQDKEIEAKLVTIIVLQTVIVNTLRWSIGKKILEQHDNDQNLNEIELKTLELPIQNTEQIENQNQTLEKSNQKSCWNTPLIAICAAIGCLILYPIQNELINDTFIHNAIFLPLQTVSRATTPTVLMILGSNLYLIYFTDINSLYSAQTVTKIVANRLILLPIIGLFIVGILKSTEIETDFCQLFILFITYCTPSAINILVMAKQYQKNAEDIVSLILLYGYLLCLISLPIWMTIYLTIFQPSL